MTLLATPSLFNFSSPFASRKVLSPSFPWTSVTVSSLFGDSSIILCSFPAVFTGAVLSLMYPRPHAGLQWFYLQWLRLPLLQRNPRPGRSSQITACWTNGPKGTEHLSFKIRCLLSYQTMAPSTQLPKSVTRQSPSPLPAFSLQSWVITTVTTLPVCLKLLIWTLQWLIPWLQPCSLLTSHTAATSFPCLGYPQWFQTTSKVKFKSIGSLHVALHDWPLVIYLESLLYRTRLPLWHPTKVHSDPDTG